MIIKRFLIVSFILLNQFLLPLPDLYLVHPYTVSIACKGIWAIKLRKANLKGRTGSSRTGAGRVTQRTRRQDGRIWQDAIEGQVQDAQHKGIVILRTVKGKRQDANLDRCRMHNAKELLL
ncbi:hypothetical protein CWC31_13235 [Pseudoalteromonas ruthenica]|nr:hypothetical protein CWC31_13235 [Pseudoalteromonas ruthenica]